MRFLNTFRVSSQGFAMIYIEILYIKKLGDFPFIFFKTTNHFDQLLY
jgi:hypothetical protein